MRSIWALFVLYGAHIAFIAGVKICFRCVALGKLTLTLTRPTSVDRQWTYGLCPFGGVWRVVGVGVDDDVEQPNAVLHTNCCI